MAIMADKTPPKDRADDRHVPDYSRMTLRLRPDMARGLELLVERLGTDATHEIRNAIRERLEKYNLWPPPKEG